MNAEKLKEIGLLLLKGLKEKEACLLADVPYSTYLSLKENDEVIRNYIEKKLIEFKKIHLEVIQKTASEKNSMYLLEKLRPEEFGNKKTGEGPTINIISAIIKDIQNDPNQNIISFNRQSLKESKDQNDTIIHEGATLLN
jgi:hypothetical protein